MMNSPRKSRRFVFGLIVLLFAAQICGAAVFRSTHRGQPRLYRRPQYELVPVYQQPPQQPQETTPPTLYVPAPAPKQDPEKVEAGKKKVLENTIKYLTQRAEDGSPSAQFTLAMRYLKGDGVLKDPEKARTYLTKAADAGFASAQHELKALESPSGVIPAKTSAPIEKPAPTQPATTAESPVKPVPSVKP